MDETRGLLKKQQEGGSDNTLLFGGKNKLSGNVALGHERKRNLPVERRNIKCFIVKRN